MVNVKHRLPSLIHFEGPHSKGEPWIKNERAKRAFDKFVKGLKHEGVEGEAFDVAVQEYFAVRSRKNERWMNSYKLLRLSRRYPSLYQSLLNELDDYLARLVLSMDLDDSPYCGRLAKKLELVALQNLTKKLSVEVELAAAALSS